MHYPLPNEYTSFYHTYIGKISEEQDIIALLETQFEPTVATLSGLSEAQQLHRYAPGKWSIREVVGHLIDTERIMAYRALCIARGDKTPIPGFEQDDYIPTGEFDLRTMEDLLDEWKAVRRSSILMAKSFSDEASARMGTASERPFSARAAVYIIAGHETHHMGVLHELYNV